MRGLLRWFTMVAVVMSLVLGPLSGNWAKAAGGNGDGSGGGQNNPLVIESSNPADGAAGVANLEYIKIVFSKNVVYMTVRDKNMQCFSLWSGSQRVPAEIIMADDQVEREKRNDVLVKPKQPLKAGLTYRVEVAPEVESKSGVTLGQKATITFTMAGGSQAPAPVTPGKDQPAAPDTQVSNQPGNISPVSVDKAAPGTIADNPAAAGNETGTTAPSAAVAEQDTANPAGSNSNNLLWIGLGAAALGVAILIYRWRGSKN
ncbi:MAG: Ig-like domain-containing protein [Syntrophomonadaceae bacterium]